MSEQTPEPQAEGVQEAPQPGGDEQPATYDREYVERLRRDTAKFRNEAKANAEAAKRLAALEDAQKSESQRQTEQLQALQRERDEAAQALARYRVATAKGVPADLVDRLRGNNEDELTEDADRLLAILRPGTQPSPPPSFDGGPRSPVNTSGDINSQIRAASGRRG